MAFLSSSLLIVSLVLLFHSGYSSMEMMKVSHFLSTEELKNRSAFLNLPLDITIETLVALLLFFVGAVLRIESESSSSSPYDDSNKKGLKNILYRKAVSEDEKNGTGVYAVLENRPIFMDILAKRASYAQWEKTALTGTKEKTF